MALTMNLMPEMRKLAIVSECKECYLLPLVSKAINIKELIIGGSTDINDLIMAQVSFKLNTIAVAIKVLPRSWPRTVSNAWRT